MAPIPHASQRPRTWTAQALVQAGKLNADPQVRERLVSLAEDEGLEVIAELWSKTPARSLPG